MTTEASRAGALPKTALLVVVPVVAVGVTVGAFAGVKAVLVVAPDAVGLFGILAGLARYRPSYRAPWLCLAAVFAWNLPVNVILASGHLLDSVSLLYLPRYPGWALAPLLWARRRHPGRDAATWIDLGIVTAPLALLSWVYLIAPQVQERDQPVWAIGMVVSFPAVQLVVVSLGLRIWLGTREHSPAMYLLGLALLADLVADVAFASRSVAESDASFNAMAAFYLLSGPLTAAAALHRSTTRLHASISSGSSTISGRRLLGLAVVALVPHAVMLGRSLGHQPLHVAAAISACALTSSLVSARMWLLVSEQRQLAVTDGLTQLKTRRRFEEELNDRYQRRCGVGVMLLDVDHFKQVNDVYGHHAGDAVLTELARRLTACVRAGDVVARYGGEEFAVLIGSADHETVLNVAERCRQSIADTPFDIADGIAIPVTASIGMAIWSDVGGNLPAGEPDDDSSAMGAGRHSALLRQADQRLYRAKAEGRNRVVAA